MGTDRTHNTSYGSVYAPACVFQFDVNDKVSGCVHFNLVSKYLKGVRQWRCEAMRRPKGLNRQNIII